MPIDGEGVEVEVTLDSGACNHVMDAEDAPGYTVHPSVGSRRGQEIFVGDGHPVPNEGEVHLNLEAPVGDGSYVPIQTNFQVAEIHRPLMSVSRICDQGFLRVHQGWCRGDGQEPAHGLPVQAPERVVRRQHETQAS